MIDPSTFESRLRRFSRVRRGLLNAALGYRLGLLALVAGVLGLLLLDRSKRNRRRADFVAIVAVFLGLGLTPWCSFGRVADNFSRSWRGLQDLLFPVQIAVEPGPGVHVYRLGTNVEVTVSLNRRTT